MKVEISHKMKVTPKQQSVLSPQSIIADQYNTTTGFTSKRTLSIDGMSKTGIAAEIKLNDNL